MRTPKITLEQWAALKAVVEEGTFALAAEALNKSQSSISYAISRLNEQLPSPALEIQGRKAELTREGRVLYRRAVQLLRQASETEDAAGLLAQGIEPEITLAVDCLMETGLLIPALESFSSEFPGTRIRMLETALSGTEEALLEKQADLVIGSKVPIGYLGTPLKSVEMIPVAVPEHPLFRLAQQGDNQINEWELRSHRQVVLRDSGTRREQDAGWLGSEQRWTVSHFSSSVRLLRSGLAFGFLPRDWVIDELADGTLRQLPLAMGANRIIPLYLMMASAEASGPACRYLADRLLDLFATAGGAGHP
ncbi:MAG: LysR family transcriptional regulator [Pseudomonadota bacterium]